MSYLASPWITCVRVSSSNSSIVSFSPWRFFLLNLTKCVVSVGSDSFCRDGAFVSIYKGELKTDPHGLFI